MISAARAALASFVLLLIATGFLFDQAYSTYSQSRDHHQASLRHAVVSATRELGLYVESRRRALRLFADEQRYMLAKVIAQPEDAALTELLAAKMRRHFPRHLAFAVADPSARSVVASEEGLFGAHCRRSVEAYAANAGALPPSPSIHVSLAPDTEHFDVLAEIPGPDNRDGPGGILFSSFRTADIRRQLQNFVDEGRQFELIEDTPDSSGQHRALVRILGSSKMVTARQPDGSALPPRSISYRAPIPDTSWYLLGWVAPDVALEPGRNAIVQAATGFFTLLLAGAIMWYAVRAERFNSSQTRLVLDGIEKERRRIARDLHDQVLADLSHVRRLVAGSVAKLSEDNEARHDLILLEDNLIGLAGGIRAAIDDLHPHVLEIVGLEAAIQDYVEKQCIDGPEVQMEMVGDTNAVLMPDQKLHLFRVVVELVNNSLRHARCSTLVVLLARTDQSVELVVEDDGIGFSPRTGAGHRSRGLTNVAARVRTLGARSRWSHARAGGSRFELRIPIGTSGGASN